MSKSSEREERRVETLRDFFGDDETDPYDLVQDFRQRQHHEQTYRVLLHDAFVDTAPSGDTKASANLRRPGFCQNALTLYAWVAGLATNALVGFTDHLPPAFWLAHPRTLRRWFLHVPAELYLGTDTLIVLLKPRRLRTVWESLVRRANKSPARIPWLENRRLVLSLDSPRDGRLRPGRRRHGEEGAIDPRTAPSGVWC